MCQHIYDRFRSLIIATVNIHIEAIIITGSQLKISQIQINKVRKQEQGYFIITRHCQESSTLGGQVGVYDSFFLKGQGVIFFHDFMQKIDFRILI